MKIAIVDDHAFVGETLLLCLNNKFAEADIKTFGSGEDLFTLIERPIQNWVPDLIISDLLLKKISGKELIKRYNELRKIHNLHMKIIVLSSVTQVDTVREIIKQGANGYLTKEASIEEIYKAINKIIMGNNFIMAGLKDSLISNMLQEDKVSLHLSPQQQALLREICNGKTVQEAATSLKLSVNTARTYLQTVMKKFNVNRTTDLVLFAIKNGLHQV